ncbi:DNA-directed RNA polymerase subunit beta [Paenibacillus sp. 1001270B_150601_E10]|uniref:DNA-directed RNA polymerase subunit beta n=1 Tax=Paenibacillus sp. 1001270B_150601_E10 TaxID=2787079 RepID=UPI002B4BB9DD|nr:DNA-directed RNA polymerase subunit beta [Paenibacillus sp. 1001270B_150601_E10]
MNDNEQNQPARPKRSLSRVETKRAEGSTDHKKSPTGEDKSKTGKPSNTGKWVFRLVGIPLLMLLFLYGGMVAGFVLLGKAPLSEALDFSTWTHVVKLVFE